MYVATRGLYRMKPPTIIVPTCIKADVEQLFEVHRRMDQSELKHNLIGLDVGNGWSWIEFSHQLKMLVSSALLSHDVVLSKLIELLFSGEEFYLRKDLKVRAFKTYHVIPSQVSLLVVIFFSYGFPFRCWWISIYFELSLVFIDCEWFMTGLCSLLCKTET